MNLLEIINEYCELRRNDEKNGTRFADDCLISRIETIFPDEKLKDNFEAWDERECDGPSTHRLITNLFFQENRLRGVAKRILIPAIKTCYDSRKGKINHSPSSFGKLDNEEGRSYHDGLEGVA